MKVECKNCPHWRHASMSSEPSCAFGFVPECCTTPDTAHGQDIAPAVDWSTDEPKETGHYWWRWQGQDEAQGICELIEHNGEMYFAFGGFLAHENGEPVRREFYPVPIPEPPKGGTR